MTFKLLMRIYPLLQNFLQLSCNAKYSYQLYKFLKTIQEDVDFYTQEEKKLIDKYVSKIDKDGQINFDNEDNKTIFFQEIEKLQNMEITNTVTTLSLPLSLIENLQLTPTDFYLLENIINFIEEE